MVLGQMLPPKLQAGDRARGPVLWRLSASGQQMPDGLPARATRRRQLAERLRQGPLPDQELRAMGAGARQALRAWTQAGWVEAVPPEAVPVVPAYCLTPAQEGVCVALERTPADRPVLLHGITGSGKTEVYLALALALAQQGRQTLLLVPEINLTPQLEQRLRERAPGLRLVVLHSALAVGERARAWAAAARGEPDLLLGTRLAVFAPAPRLGAIILDEEQDASYKQGEGVRYHAREVALFRGEVQNARVVLGSATPSLESYARAQAGRYLHLALNERAVAGASLPAVRLVPLPSVPIGEPLLEAIRARLARGEQSLLFVNRRGYAPVLLCRACGWEAPCPHCAARLVVHLADAKVRCHHCGHQRSIPRACPECGNLDLLPRGFGTQRLEEHLHQILPEARLLRIDRDSTRRRDAWLDMLAQIRRGDAEVLIGTQMLTKGHDFPEVTLVGVLGADNAFFSADFRASERLFAQLLQVAGRAGRAGKAGEVLIQTAFAGHPLLRALLAHDYAAGAQLLLEERRSAALPPYSHLALLHAEGPRRDGVDGFLERAHALARELAAKLGGEIEVYTPVPSALARRAGIERGQLLIQGVSRRALNAFLERWHGPLREESTRVRWFLDVDPIDFS